MIYLLTKLFSLIFNIIKIIIKNICKIVVFPINIIKKLRNNRKVKRENRVEAYIENTK